MRKLRRGPRAGRAGSLPLSGGLVPSRRGCPGSASGLTLVPSSCPEHPESGASSAARNSSDLLALVTHWRPAFFQGVGGVKGRELLLRSVSLQGEGPKNALTPQGLPRPTISKTPDSYWTGMGMGLMVGSVPQTLCRMCPFPPGPVARLEFQARTLVNEYILNTERAAACQGFLPESGPSWVSSAFSPSLGRTRRSKFQREQKGMPHLSNTHTCL